jgi:succinate dehydrogenase hydrophobic anchor subunit
MEVMNKNEWASRREGQMEQVMQNMTGIMMVDNVRLGTMTFK